jgi:hypothetical protein
MHIVFITSEFPTRGLPHGGVGTFVKFLSKNLVQRDIRVSVIGFYKSGAKEEASEEEGVSVYRLPSSRWRTFRFLDHAIRINKALASLYFKHKIDIVESAELGLAFIRKIRTVK